MEGGGEWRMERRKGNGEEVERFPFDDGQQVNSGMYTFVVLHSRRRPYVHTRGRQDTTLINILPHYYFPLPPNQCCRDLELY